MKSATAMVKAEDVCDENAEVADGVYGNLEAAPPPADPIDPEERRALAESKLPAEVFAAAMPAASCSFFCFFASDSFSFL